MLSRRSSLFNLSFGFGSSAPGVVAPVISITTGSGYAGSTYTSTIAGQWTRDGADIVGETATTYLTVTADVGHEIRCGASNTIQMWTPQTAIDEVGGAWWDFRDVADGAVASLPERSGLTLPLIQATGGSQPTKASTGIDFDGSADNLAALQAATVVESILLPDVAGMTAAKGFCPTGIDNKPGTNIWYAGNHGLNVSPDATYASSVVKFTWDGPGTTPALVSNFAMDAQIPGIGSIQDVKWDPIRGTVWYMDVVNAKFREIDPDTGVLTGNDVTVTGFANGAAIVGDDVWTTENSGGSNRFQKYNLTTEAAVGGPVASGTTAIDMLYYDAATNCLLMSAGTAPGTCTVRAYSLATGSPVATTVVLTLPAAVDCIEGIYAAGPYLYVMNNAEFHGGASGLNEIIVLRMIPLVSATAILSVTFVVEGTSATGNSLLVTGVPTGSSNTTGIALYESNAPSVICVVTPGNTLQQSTTSSGAPAFSQMRILLASIDTATEVCSLFMDGAAIGTGTISNCSGWLALNGTIRVSTDFDNPTLRYFNGKMKDWLIIASSADRLKVEGWQAHQHSITLASGHVYETLGPRIQ